MTQQVLCVVACVGLNFPVAVPNAAQIGRGWTTIYYDPTSGVNPRQWWQLNATKTGFVLFAGPLPASSTVAWANIVGIPEENAALEAALNAKADAGAVTTALATKYTLPPAGMPMSDMELAVADGIALANTALQQAVTSVNGVGFDVDGAVELDASDIGLGHVDDTSDATKWSATATLTNKKILLPKTIATDGDWQGVALTGHVVGAPLAKFLMAYIDATGLLQIATSASPATPARGMLLAATTVSGQPVDLLVQGVIRNNAWAWTVGGDLYLSSAGALTQVPPTGVNVKTQKVGWARASNVAQISMGQNDYVTG